MKNKRNHKDLKGLKIWLVYIIVSTLGLIVGFLSQQFILGKTIYQQVYGMGLLLSNLIPLLLIFLGVLILIGYHYKITLFFYSSLAIILITIILNGYFAVVNSNFISPILIILIHGGVGYYFIKNKDYFLKY